MSTQPKRYITPEEYLEIERKAEFKSEYYNGEIFPMHLPRRPGDTEDPEISGTHDILVTNIIVEINKQLQGRHCTIFGSEKKVRVGSAAVRADVSVVCREERPVNENQDVIENPTLIVEVMSRSSAGYDRGEKFHSYQGLSQLKEYVVVSNEEHRVQVFERKDNHTWLLRIYQQPTDAVRLTSIHCTLLLKNIYDKTNLSVEPRL